jgi:glucose-6-phosphate isomerase
MFDIPETLGGRYSVVSPVGLLPAAILGIDPGRILAGAEQMRAQCRAASVDQNPALKLASAYYAFYQHKQMPLRVMQVWGKRMEAFGMWYDQLCAESLGKDEVGPTPFTAVGTRDLHSRGQQHQEGTRDRLLTHLLVDSPGGEALWMPRDNNADGLDYAADKSVQTMLQVAADATQRAYLDAERPSISVHVDDITPESLGALFYLFEQATVIEGLLLRINPLDQPGVELYKRYLRGGLGSPDPVDQEYGRRLAEQRRRRSR